MLCRISDRVTRVIYECCVFSPDITDQESRLQPVNGRTPADERCMFHPDVAAQASRLPPDQAFLVVCGCPGRYSPAKAGTPVRHISGLFFKLHKPGLQVSDVRI